MKKHNSTSLRGWLSRSTVFAAFFAITAYILAVKGLLTGQYAAVITALHITVVGRAIAQDYNDRAAAPAPETGDANANG